MSASSRASGPDRRRVRVRLAVGTALSAIAVAALVVLGASLLATWQASDPDDSARAAAARLGEESALVIVSADDAGAAADARAAALRWTLVALGVAAVPAVAVGWFTAGRLLGRVDRALADLDRVDLDRRRHLQEVAHDLRTPLAVVRANLELAADSTPAGTDVAGWIDAARRAGDRMGHTVSDLAGDDGADPTRDVGPFELGAEARALIAQHAGPAGTGGVRLRTGDGPTVCVPAVDRASLHTTFANLLDNAVRLSPPGSTVVVDWGRWGEWAWMAVIDEGPGVPDHLRGRVFQRGWTGRPDRTEHGGRGLGLAIARQVVEAHGGALTVDAGSPHGSVFTAWLPLTPEASRGDVVGIDGIHPAIRPWDQSPDALTPA